jgi:hypothetical protein
MRRAEQGIDNIMVCWISLQLNGKVRYFLQMFTGFTKEEIVILGHIHADYSRSRDRLLVSSAAN